MVRTTCSGGVVIMTAEISDLEIHRTVSNHVLNYIPIKPMSAQIQIYRIHDDQYQIGAKESNKATSFSSRELKLAVNYCHGRKVSIQKF